jgi:hypothetical protein
MSGNRTVEYICCFILFLITLFHYILFIFKFNFSFINFYWTLRRFFSPLRLYFAPHLHKFLHFLIIVSLSSVFVSMFVEMPVITNLTILILISLPLVILQYSIYLFSFQFPFSLSPKARYSQYSEQWNLTWDAGKYPHQMAIDWILLKSSTNYMYLIFHPPPKVCPCYQCGDLVTLIVVTNEHRHK